MPFLEQAPQVRMVPGMGPKDAPLCIVGEAPGAYEDSQLKPFVGPAGSVLEQCMHSAGLIRSDCYLTNVVKVRPPGNDIKGYFDGKSFTEEGLAWVDDLATELLEVTSPVLVACGATAFAALCGVSKITKYRGYAFESKPAFGPRPVIPCIHPSAALRGQYLYRHLIAADLRKAHRIAEGGYARPERQLVYDFASLEEVLAWLEYYEQAKIVCFDIEVVNYEVSCIGFSSDPAVGCSIPIAGRWSALEELAIWRGIQRVLGNPLSIKVVQNGIFDIDFLASRNGIVVRGELRDTMIAHHVMFPELQKGLAFLGSLYCGTQEYWKDMVRFDDIKAES